MVSLLAARMLGTSGGLTQLPQFLVMLFYVYFFAPRTCYGGWSSAMFHDLGACPHAVRAKSLLN